VVNHSSLAFWITVAWLLVSFHGAMLTLTRFRDGVADRRWLAKMNINGPRTIMATGGIRAAGARLWLFSAFFLIGINALVGPTAPALTVRMLVATVLLVLTLVGQAVAAQLDARDSMRLMTMLQIARAVKTGDPDPFHAEDGPAHP
jgi:hypothetical protein